MCSYLASFPAALAHAFIARYSRPGDVVLDPFSGRGTTPLQAVRRGPHRRRQRPQPVRPPADRGQGRAGDARRRPTTRLTAAPAGLDGDAGAWLALARRRRRRSAGDTRVPRAGSGAGPAARDETVPAEVALAFHPATLGQLLFVRTRLRLDDRTDRFLAAAITGILHGKSASYLSELMPNTFSMAPRYVRDVRRADRVRLPERDVFDGLAAKLDRLFRQPPPADRGRRAARRRPRRRAAGPGGAARARPPGPRPARRDLAALPAGRQVRLLQLAADLVPRASTRARSTRRSTTPTTASRTSPSCATCSPGLRPVLADDAVVVLVIGDVETDRGRRDPRRRRPRRAGLGAGRRAGGLSTRGRRARRRGRRPQDDQAVGRRGGRATKTDRILVLGATEAGRRRALAGAALDVDWAWPPRALRAI